MEQLSQPNPFSAIVGIFNSRNYTEIDIKLLLHIGRLLEQGLAKMGTTMYPFDRSNQGIDNIISTLYYLKNSKVLDLYPDPKSNHLFAKLTTEYGK
jgi:hypothetical protein